MTNRSDYKNLDAIYNQLMKDGHTRLAKLAEGFRDRYAPTGIRLNDTVFTELPDKRSKKFRNLNGSVSADVEILKHKRAKRRREDEMVITVTTPVIIENETMDNEPESPLLPLVYRADTEIIPDDEVQDDNVPELPVSDAVPMMHEEPEPVVKEPETNVTIINLSTDMAITKVTPSGPIIETDSDDDFVAVQGEKEEFKEKFKKICNSTELSNVKWIFMQFIEYKIGKVQMIQSLNKIKRDIVGEGKWDINVISGLPEEVLHLDLYHRKVTKNIVRPDDIEFIEMENSGNVCSHCSRTSVCKKNIFVKKLDTSYPMCTECFARICTWRDFTNRTLETVRSLELTTATCKANFITTFEKNMKEDLKKTFILCSN